MCSYSIWIQICREGIVGLVINKHPEELSSSAPFRPQRSATAKLLIQWQYSCFFVKRTCLCLSHLCLPWFEVCFGLSHSAGPVTLNVVLSEVVPELRRQQQAVYALVGGVATDHSPAQVLEGEREGPRQRPGKEGLEEEAGGRVTVVPQQSCHTGIPVHAWVAHIKAETLVVLLDACMQGAAVASEANREEELVLGRVSE